MKARKNLYKRGDVWWYRRQVPVGLELAYAGQKELRGSLGSKDKKEAERRLNAKLVELEAEFDKFRTEAQALEKEEAFIRSDRYRHAVTDAESLIVEVTEDFPEWGSGVSWDDIPPDPADALRMIDRGLDEIAQAKEFGIPLHRGVDHDGEPLWVIPYRFVDAVEKHYRELLDAEAKTLLAYRATIEGREEQQSNEEAMEGAESKRLADLVPAWAAEKKPTDRTMLEVRTALSRFEEACGPLPYAQISIEHGRKFKTYLLSLGKKGATVKKFWTMINTILNNAKDNGLIKSNPLEGISFNPQDDGAQREEFTCGDYEAIFGTMPKTDPDWWAFRFCVYTGARLNEVWQLHRSDIRQEDGILCFDLNEDAIEGTAAKSLKTKNSVRVVPIHEQLLRDGLMEWLPESGPLFEGTSAAASKRLNRRISAAGIADKNKVVHSARHTFKSACREVMSEDVHDRLTGHTSQRSGRKYGSHSIASLKRAIDKVAFGIEDVG